MKTRKRQKKNEYLPEAKEKKPPDKADDRWLDYYGGGEYYGSPPTRGVEYDPYLN